MLAHHKARARNWASYGKAVPVAQDAEQTVTVRCARCPEWSSVTTCEKRAEVWKAHVREHGGTR